MHDTLTAALAALHMTRCCIHPVGPHAAPLPAPPLMSRLALAVHPPSMAILPPATVASELLASIAFQAPPLRLQASEIVYTDGSKRGTSITAAWVHPRTGTAQMLSVPGPSTPQSTALRGELVAIHAALQSGSLSSDHPLHIMTDSLTSLYLIAAYLVRPTQLLFHKHKWLVADIAQRLVCQERPVRLTKVRAHIGVIGNTHADELANQAHEDLNACVASFKDPIVRGPAWIQHQFGETFSDIDNLQHHALTVAERMAAKLAHDRADHLKSKTFMKVDAAMQHANGLHAASSNAIWQAGKITDFQCKRAIQVRYGTLVMNSRLASWYPNGDISPSCPLCHAPRDDIPHRLGSCTARPVKNQICARHGHAVHAIAEEINLVLMATA